MSLSVRGGIIHKKAKKAPFATEAIASRIFMLRGQRVMIDADLAALYGASTKRLNQQVKRNAERFPADFMFQLTPDERREVVANCDHLQRLKFSSAMPYAFTEHGALMAASAVGPAPYFFCCGGKAASSFGPISFSNWRIISLSGSGPTNTGW
jgi:hypothetical protein